MFNYHNMGLHNLGKEMLLHTIAKAFRTWIGVDPSRIETLELIEMPNVFTCEIDKVRIRVVKNNEITRKNMQAWNSEEPTIAILPTCLYVGGKNPFANLDNVFVVPYSDHCSFEELQKFVQVVKPRRIIPIVHKHRLSQGETVNTRVNMHVFQSLLDCSPSQEYRIPHSVTCFMSSIAQQPTKKRARAQLCTRKVAKIKKPQGVVFPTSPGKKVEKDEKCGFDTGNTESSPSKEVPGDQRSPVTSEDLQKGRMSDKPVLSIKEGITGDENKLASSVYNKSSLSDNDKIERSNKSTLNCEDTIVSPNIECGKIGSEPQRMSEEDIDYFDVIIPANEVNLVASSTIEPFMSDGKPEGNLHLTDVSNGEGFQCESMVQETSGSKNRFG